MKFARLRRESEKLQRLRQTPLDAIRQHPKFAELKARIQENPEKAPQVVMSMAGSAPDLVKAIMENREEFRAMMMESSKL